MISTLKHMSIALCPWEYFIPHHPVFKGYLVPNKIRVDFDPSVTESNIPDIKACKPALNNNITLSKFFCNFGCTGSHLQLTYARYTDRF